MIPPLSNAHHKCTLNWYHITPSQLHLPLLPSHPVTWANVMSAHTQVLGYDAIQFRNENQDLSLIHHIKVTYTSHLDLQTIKADLPHTRAQPLAAQFLPSLSVLTRSCSRSGGGGGKSGSWGWKASLTLATAPRIRYPESRKLFCRPKHKTLSLSAGQVRTHSTACPAEELVPINEAGCEAASRNHDSDKAKGSRTS